VPLLVSHESKYLTLVGNAGFSRPIHAESRDTTATLAVGAGRAFFRKLAVMGELHNSSTMDFKRDRLLMASVGCIYGVRKAIWYGRVGHTVFSDDGRHAYLGFGMKVLIDTGRSSGAQP
jgi:hypothetical protein